MSAQSISPTIPAASPADDTSAQRKLRSQLRQTGLKVCYQSRRDGNSDLYVMDADGSNPVNITNTPDVDEVYPHVSADGKRVCFTTVAVQGRRVRFDIHWMNIDGSNRTLVARDATDPCWDPSGTKIAFVKRLGQDKTRDYQNRGLFVYDVRTAECRDITAGKLHHAYVPCWSPAGNWIVATVHEHPDFGHAIIAIDPASGQFKPLQGHAALDLRLKEGVNGCRPDLSWDGKMICWNPGDYHIYIAAFAPGQLVRGRPVARAPEGGSVYHGDFSPDGNYIAYSMNPDVAFSDPRTRALWDIFVARLDGSTYVQLTFDHANNKQPEFFLPT
ncbi:MAG: TolB family protein [Phycisphaerae bacterium]